MKWFSIIMVSLMFVAISLVSSNETGKDEPNRLAKASNGGKGKYHLSTLVPKKPNCHYKKSQWSPCDKKTDVKTRTFTLENGDDTCEKSKKIEKKCKKACRYVKGTWSQCNTHNEMIRTDTIKDPSTENSNCEKTRQITKKCKSKGRGNKGNKQNRNRQ